MSCEGGGGKHFIVFGDGEQQNYLVFVIEFCNGDLLGFPDTRIGINRIFSVLKTFIIKFTTDKNNLGWFAFKVAILINQTLDTVPMPISWDILRTTGIMSFGLCLMIQVVHKISMIKPQIRNIFQIMWWSFICEYYRQLTHLSGKSSFKVVAYTHLRINIFKT